MQLDFINPIRIHRQNIQSSMNLFHGNSYISHIDKIRIDIIVSF